MQYQFVISVGDGSSASLSTEVLDTIRADLLKLVDVTEVQVSEIVTVPDE